MQSRDLRAAILTLQKQGLGVRAIARAVGGSRNTVRRVLSSGSAEVPSFSREQRADPHEETIRALFALYKGNLVLVQENLAAQNIVLAYSTLTGFCRRRGIGQTPKERIGRYHFEPGQEMQHDTSPHDVLVDGKVRRLHCASLVLCYSRMLFVQAYPTWNRFWAKVFLTEAHKTFRGSATRCVVDNSSVIVARGTGKNAVMAPEMVAYGTSYGYGFLAHELGDANRSALVERNFDYVENNFYPGRIFRDVPDVNQQMRDWCDKANARQKKSIGTTPVALFATELTALRPLPPYTPPVYLLHRRTVDMEGYIHLHTNRYSLPTELIDREVTVHETKDQVRIFDGPKLVVEHARQEDGARKRLLVAEHEKQARWQKAGTARPPSPEERRLRADSPIMAEMVTALYKHHGGRCTRKLMRLHRLWLEYPEQPLRSALADALKYGLFDLDRIETLVLRHVAGDFFRLPIDDAKDTARTEET